MSLPLEPKPVCCFLGSCCSGTSVVSCLVVAAAAAVRRGMRAPAAAVSEVSLTVSAPPAVYAYTPTHT